MHGAGEGGKGGFGGGEVGEVVPGDGEGGEGEGGEEEQQGIKSKCHDCVSVFGISVVGGDAWFGG